MDAAEIIAPCSMVCVDVSMMTRMFCVGVGLTCSLEPHLDRRFWPVGRAVDDRGAARCAGRRGSSGSLGWG